MAAKCEVLLARVAKMPRVRRHRPDQPVQIVVRVAHLLPADPIRLLRNLPVVLCRRIWYVMLSTPATVTFVI